MNYQNLMIPEPVQAEKPAAPGTPPPGAKEHLGDVFAMYVELAQRFNLPCPPCSSLPEDGDVGAASGVQGWLELADGYFDAYHLRLFIQTSPAMTEKRLRVLIRHYLAKSERIPTDRDKLDFLLVQYVYFCRPGWGAGLGVPVQDIANTLRPIIGDAPEISEAFMEAVDPILHQVETCGSLSQLIEWGCVEQSRRLKEAVGESFYEPEAIVAFTWLNFVFRRACFRLLHSEVEAIRQGLLALEERGSHEVDCRRAQLSSAEPIKSLLKHCDDWTQLFRAPYSVGQLANIAGMRSSVEDALAGPTAHPGVQQTPPLIQGLESQKVTSAGGWPEIPIYSDDIFLQKEDQPDAAACSPDSTVKPSARFSEQSKSRPDTPPSEWHISPASTLRSCLESIRTQLNQKSAQGMGSVSYNHTRLLLHSWESESFRNPESFGSFALQCVVGARAILAEAQEKFWSSRDETLFAAVIELAEQQVKLLREWIERARRETSLEVAANLSASSKRLQIATIKAKGLLGKSG